MDLSGPEFRQKWKRVYNKTVQLAVAQSIIVCALFWGLIGEWSLQNVHEHVMNFVVMIISYTVSEGNFILAVPVFEKTIVFQSYFPENSDLQFLKVLENPPNTFENSLKFRIFWRISLKNYSFFELWRLLH